MADKQNPQKRKINKWKLVISIVAGVILVLAAVGFIFIRFELLKIKEYVPEATVNPQDETFDSDAPVDNSAPVIEPEDVTWPSDVDSIHEDGILNFLLIGQDRRPGQSRQRSDSMIILSYNTKSKTVKLISLMRDMYVQIPGYSDNRINAAYQFGGMELLDQTISINFGVDIDGNVEVDFNGFASIVDLLGGIDIEVADYDAAYMIKHYGYDVSTGMNHLNGEQTLNYSRIRHAGNADYERTERQRNVMNLIIDKILSLSTSEKLKMFDAILPYLTTDMSEQQIFSYCMTVINNGIISIEKYRIPADHTYTSPVIRGMMVLLPDLQKNQELLKEYISK